MPVSPSKRKPSSATPCAPPRLESVSKPLNRLRCAPGDAPRRCRSVRIQETYPDEPPPCRTPPGTRLARPWTSRQTLGQQAAEHACGALDAVVVHVQVCDGAGVLLPRHPDQHALLGGS